MNASNPSEDSVDEAAGTMDSTIDFTMEEFCKKYSEFKHLIPFLTGICFVVYLL